MPYKGGLSGIEAAGYLHAAGFGASDSVLQTAIAIAKAESNLNPTAKGGPNSNGTFDWGLMQINDIHKPSTAVKTQPLANARAAFDIYTRAGKSFKPWSTYNNGAYRAHMEFARQSVLGLRSAGPKFEADLIAGKNPGSAENPISLDAPGGGGPLAGLSNIDNGITGAISGAANAVSAQFAKIGGNIATVAIALVFITLGVVILARGAAGGAAGAVVKGVVK